MAFGVMRWQNDHGVHLMVVRSWQRTSESRKVSPMWLCQQCGEEIEDTFDVCSNCGATPAGEVHQNFPTEPEADDLLATDTQPRRTLRWMTIVSLIALTIIGSTEWWWSLTPLQREVHRLDYGTDSMKRSGPERLAELIADPGDPLPALTEVCGRFHASQLWRLMELISHLRKDGWVGTKAFPVLETLLDDEDPSVRDGAGRLLLGLHGGKHYQFQARHAQFLNNIMEADKGMNQSVPAYKAIGRIGQPGERSAIPTLIKLMHDQDRAGAAINKSLASIGPAGDLWENDQEIDATIQMLVDLLDRDFWVENRDFQYTNRIDGSHRFLFGHITHEKSRYYNAPVSLLVEIGPPAIPALMASLDHSNFRVREKSALILGLTGSDSNGSVTALVKVLKEDVHPRVRRSAAQALGKIGPDAKAAVPALLKALEDQTDEKAFLDNSWSMALRVKQSIPNIARAALRGIDPDRFGTSESTDSE